MCTCPPSSYSAFETTADLHIVETSQKLKKKPVTLNFGNDMKSGTLSLIMVIICFIFVKEKKKYENLKKKKLQNYIEHL